MFDKKKHTFRRQINKQALSPKAIHDLQDKILQILIYFCQELVEATASDWGSAKDMTKFFGYLESNIMGRYHIQPKLERTATRRGSP